MMWLQETIDRLDTCQRALFDERVAIMQYDGGMAWMEARSQALNYMLAYDDKDDKDE